MTSPGRGADTEDTAPAVLDVVGYLHTDPILGGQPRAALGVLVKVAGDVAQVRPLQSYDVQVPLADVRALSAADLGLDGKAGA